MKKVHLLLAALVAALPACENMSPPLTPPEPIPPPVVTAPPAPVVTAPPEPTPEEIARAAEEKKKAELERKKAEALQKLAADRTQWEAESKAEADRWTAEVRKEAKALAATRYPNAKAAITAALKGKHRKPSSAPRDVYRHPLETLEFFGLKPTMTVLEYGPGDGWYTELLAPTLAAKGKLIVTSGDPNGPRESRGTYYAERLKRFLDSAPEVYGKVERIIIPSGPPKLGIDGKLDMVILCRELHGMARDKLVPGVLAEIFTALKPGGVLGVEQHRARADARAEDTAKNGYLPEAWVIAEFEKVGFKLAGKAEINANPRDTKDYSEGVWALPPSYELKDRDRAKYAEIGESDRMTLKFVKPGPAPAASPAGKPAAKPKK